MKNFIILVLLVALFGLTNPTRLEVQTRQSVPYVVNEVPPDFWASLAVSGAGALVDVLAGRQANLGERVRYWNLYLFSYASLDGGNAGVVRCILALRSGVCGHFPRG